MKLSELIAKLQQAYQEYGDIDCQCWSYSGQMRFGDVDFSVYSDKSGVSRIVFDESTSVNFVLDQKQVARDHALEND